MKRRIRTILLLVLFVVGALFIYVIRPSYVAAVMLVMLALFVLLGGLTVLFSGRKLAATAKALGTSERGTSFAYDVELSNGSILPLVDVHVKGQIRNMLTGEESPFDLPFSLGPRGKAQATLTVEGNHCGGYGLYVDQLEVGDLLGLFHRKAGKPERKQAIAIAGDPLAMHCVLPHAVPYELTEGDLYHYDMESYLYSQQESGGDPSETFRIREYRPGDSVKSIHWKLSAKTDDVMIREPGLPIENKVMLLMDYCSAMKPEDIDALEDLMYSLSQAMLKRDIKHTLSWFDHRSGSVELRAITNEENLLEALLASLECPMQSDDCSAVYRFLGAEVEQSWSSYLYLSNDTRDTERLSEYGNVSIYRTDQDN